MGIRKLNIDIQRNKHHVVVTFPKGIWNSVDIFLPMMDCRKQKSYSLNCVEPVHVPEYDDTELFVRAVYDGKIMVSLDGVTGTDMYEIWLTRWWYTE